MPSVAAQQTLFTTAQINSHPASVASSNQQPQQHQQHNLQHHPVATTALVPHKQNSRSHNTNHIAHGGDTTKIEGPPRKKPRLTLRNSGYQTTLDKYTQPKPPTKVTTSRPGGQLLQTVNGVTNELNVTDDELLQPTPKPVRRPTRSPQPPQPQPAKGEDKRTLRSHDEGPRLKSELAIYFPAYEDIIFDAPKEEEFLNVDTALYITDDAALKLDTPAKSSKAATARRTSVNGSGGLALSPQKGTASQFNGSPVLNLDFVAKSIADDTEDPLTESHFLKSHKRAERKEKQLRNIEKERAMHEKVQLERILDGLLRHDWLRVLGITGVTDSEAKKYESKRDYFIAEVEALVDKFRQWKEQEKKQRLEKEAAAAREAEEEIEEEEDETSEGSLEPPSSDLNASAARQLQQETVTALKSSTAKSSAKGKERAVRPTSHPGTPTVAAPKYMPPPPPPVPETPITSFYAKRHLRDAAIGRARHGRNVTAFGHPLPEMRERDFELPEEYVTEDALRSNARERRRRKRESTANTAS